MKPETPNLPESIDVVIVGAGIAGISAAWFLNKAGLRVAVCEKGIVEYREFPAHEMHVK